MARQSIGDIRRAELSQAAFEALVRHGIRGTTLDRVAKIAGVSKGVVLHHFRDKDALFEGVQRKANTVLRICVTILQRPCFNRKSVMLGYRSARTCRTIGKVSASRQRSTPGCAATCLAHCGQ